MRDIIFPNSIVSSQNITDIRTLCNHCSAPFDTQYVCASVRFFARCRF